MDKSLTYTVFSVIYFLSINLMENNSKKEELIPYINKILERKNIDYFYRDNEIIVDLSGNQFHKIVTRAKCEMLNEKDGLDNRHTYYVSKAENIARLMSDNPEYEFFIEYPYNPD